MTQCELVFFLQLTTYAKECFRAAFVVSLLTTLHASGELPSGRPILSAVSSSRGVPPFKEEMIRVFDRSVFGREACHQLSTPR